MPPAPAPAPPLASTPPWLVLHPPNATVAAARTRAAAKEVAVPGFLRRATTRKGIARSYPSRTAKPSRQLRDVVGAVEFCSTRPASLSGINTGLESLPCVSEDPEGDSPPRFWPRCSPAPLAAARATHPSTQVVAKTPRSTPPW